MTDKNAKKVRHILLENKCMNCELFSSNLSVLINKTNKYEKNQYSNAYSINLFFV